MEFLILLTQYGLPACEATFAGIDQACSSVGVSPRPRRRAHVAPDPPPCYSVKPGLPPTPAQLYNLCRLVSTRMTRTTRMREWTRATRTSRSLTTGTMRTSRTSSARRMSMLPVCRSCRHTTSVRRSMRTFRSSPATCGVALTCTASCGALPGSCRRGARLPPRICSQVTASTVSRLCRGRRGRMGSRRGRMGTHTCPARRATRASHSGLPTLAL